jgi:hypothetical protein
MTEAAVIGLLIVFPVVGLATWRWPALMAPAIGWPVFYGGLDRDWWDHGTGDGWEYAAVLLTTFGLLTTALAIAGARAWRRPDFPRSR